MEDHSSIELNRKQDIEPINLDQCFEAFTKEEELGEEESWYGVEDGTRDSQYDCNTVAGIALDARNIRLLPRN